VLEVVEVVDVIDDDGQVTVGAMGLSSRVTSSLDT
jgi:hypothetical protein